MAWSCRWSMKAGGLGTAVGSSVISRYANEMQPYEVAGRFWETMAVAWICGSCPLRSMSITLKTAIGPSHAHAVRGSLLQDGTPISQPASAQTSMSPSSISSSCRFTK
jgi:hypothetical protein